MPKKNKLHANQHDPKTAPRKKNEGAQSNGQFERDPQRRTGNFTAAGDAPRMIK